MVEIFREVRRVLRDDGTLWLNLGDSYGTGTTASRVSGARGIGENTQGAQDAVPRCGGMAKQLMGIPWRIAFALQADGWYLRSDIIWHKPNPMPESVTDRPTKAHEYIFLMSKSERYYYDAEAIAEPSIHAGRVVAYDGSQKNCEASKDPHMQTRIDQNTVVKENRNRRTVWTIPTAPCPEAHFATFPPKLIEPCILAGAPGGGVVLDPFLGAGTTALTAHRLGRACVGIELNPEYFDICVRRLTKATAQGDLFRATDEKGQEALL